jgi:hypothetical protein
MPHSINGEIRTSKLPAMVDLVNWPALLLAAATIGLVLNILILPMLPTNDGAMHTYYAQVFAHLLGGDSIYSNFYAIRSLFPPYAFHFYLLVGLHHLFNPYLTERIVACLAILWTFAGFARLSKALGKNGIWGCFFVLPFLANWPLYMGFTNFVLGTATLLFAMGYWLDHVEAYGAKQAVATVVIVFILAAQHPIPLFLFFIFAAMELASSCVLILLETGPSVNARRLISYLRKRQLPVLLIFALGLLALFWIRTFVEKGAFVMNLPSVAEIVKRIASLVTMNEISPFTFEWWLYTVALLSVAVPAAILAFRHWRGQWRDRRVFSVTLLLFFCVALYLVLPNQVNSAFHTHRRFSITAIFLMLALGSAAPMTFATRRRMMIVALIAATVTAGLQAKANREVIARITPSIKACLVSPGSRLLVARCGTAVYGHPLRYIPDDDAPAYWATQCQAILVNSFWLDQAYYPLRSASGSSPEIGENSAGLAIQRAVLASRPIPYSPDVIAIESFDGGKRERTLITSLEKRYGFSPFPGPNRNYIYLFRSHTRKLGKIYSPATHFPG